MIKEPTPLDPMTTESLEMQQENASLQLVRKIALLAARIRDRQRLLQEAIPELQQAFATDGAGVYQLPEPDAPLHLVANSGLEPELVLELQKVPPGKGLISQVVKTGVPHNWVDLRGEPQVYCQAILDNGWRSLLALPLIAHERLLGVLFLYQRIPRQFSQQDIDLLDQCCQLLAAAIDTSELVEKLEWQHRLTHASQRELDRSRKQLREHVKRLEEGNRSLEQANRMKDRFLALASHELRTPLTWIVTATELLEDQLHEIPPDSQRLLETIFKGGRRLNSLVEDLLEMARIEARDIYLARESINLPAFLNKLSSQLQEEASRRQLTLELGSVCDHLSPVGDQHHLRQALERILKNALKFTPPGGHIRIEAVHCSSNDLFARRTEIEPFSPEFFNRMPLHDHLEVRIIDSGVGIAKQDRLQIFDKFHGAGDISLHGRQHNAVQGPSAGLGLPLAKGMIEAHGGMVWVAGAPEQNSGSCFHVLLPLYKPGLQADD